MKKLWEKYREIIIYLIVDVIMCNSNIILIIWEIYKIIIILFWDIIILMIKKCF